MTGKRLGRDMRQDQIVEEATRLAAIHGYKNVTHEMVGEACGIGRTGVQYHFPLVETLRHAVMRCAVRNKVLPVIAQGLVAADKYALRASPTVQRLAADALLS